MTCAHPFRFAATMPAPTRPVAEWQAAAAPPRGPRPVVGGRGRPLHRWLHVRTDGRAHRRGRTRPRRCGCRPACSATTTAIPSSSTAWPRCSTSCPTDAWCWGSAPGWMTTDYEAAGHPARPAGSAREPVRRSAHGGEGTVRPGAVRLRRGALRGARASTGCPKPVQQPHPPVFVGGGSPRVLRLAGREADIVGINASLRAGELGARRGATTCPFERWRRRSHGHARARSRPGAIPTRWSSR